MLVPFGFAVISYFMSKAHSMVLPATTEPSFAMTLTGRTCIADQWSKSEGRGNECRD
jgi:hypothetical protein